MSLEEIEGRLAAVGRTAVGTKQFVVHAPTDLGALVAVVREVEALHRPHKVICLNPFHSNDCDGEVCDTCDTAYPCPTATALQPLTATRPTPPTTDSPNEGTNA